MIASPKIRQVQLVGRKIRQLRRDHKLTQVELSTRLGIQQSDLSRMEKGEYRVSLDTLFRIVAEFKLSIGEFFDEVNQPQEVSTRALRVARDLSRLDEAAQREVEDFVAFKREQLERRSEELSE